MIRVEQKQALS